MQHPRRIKVAVCHSVSLIGLILSKIERSMYYINMFQLNLQFRTETEYLKEYLQKAVGKDIALVLTDNSTSVLSFKVKGRTVHIRLHRMFLSAGKEVLDELADFIGSKRKRTPVLRKFINDNAHALKCKPPKRINLQPHGRHHDLASVYRLINEEYFEGRVNAGITWGAKRPRRAAARRTLGSYSALSNTIRINPALDSKNVPKYFMELLVYHEMLHADMGVENGDKRRSLHSREFRRREKLFKHYEKALAWEKKML